MVDTSQVNVTVETAPVQSVVVTTQPSSVVVSTPQTASVVSSSTERVEVTELGIRGEQGPAGPPGPPGSSVFNPFVYNQTTPQEVWTIVHNLNTFPTVTITDSAGQVVYGEIDYLGANAVRLSFGSAFSGVAYLV